MLKQNMIVVVHQHSFGVPKMGIILRQKTPRTTICSSKRSATTPEVYKNWFARLPLESES